MRLIAEIDTADGTGTLRLSCDGEKLTVGEVCVALAEFRDALNAVAPLSGRQRQRVDIAGDPQVLLSTGSTGEAKGALYRPTPPTRDASGARIGPSPRYAMRAAKPEANVEVPYETVDDGETAA